MGVTGIGGLFFRADDPDALAAWYKTHLGVGVGGGCDGSGTGVVDQWSWNTAAGPRVDAPFAATTDYLPAAKAFMLNFRVIGLDDLLAGLRAGGIAVETRAEWDAPETSRFARIHDPEGNAIELWEPPAAWSVLTRATPAATPRSPCRPSRPTLRCSPRRSSRPAAASRTAAA